AGARRQRADGPRAGGGVVGAAGVVGDVGQPARQHVLDRHAGGRAHAGGGVVVGDRDREHHVAAELRRGVVHALAQLQVDGQEAGVAGVVGLAAGQGVSAGLARRRVGVAVGHVAAGVGGGEPVVGAGGGDELHHVGAGGHGEGVQPAGAGGGRLQHGG